MKVLFIVPYPTGKAASQRYRVEQWLPVLQGRGVSYAIKPFWSEASWAILYKHGYFLQKLTGLITGMLKRLLLLAELWGHDYIFIHREATPVGPAWFEWLAAKVFREKIIFDYDDAIWLPNTTDDNSVAAMYKWHHKTAQIIKWSYKVSCGNQHLQQYALRYNSQAMYLPTVVDTHCRYNRQKEQQTARVTLGWIGSHSTLSYLKLIEPVLQQLEQKYDFEFIVIADRKPDLNLQVLNFIPWAEDSEIENLLKFNIGVMPLPATEWAKGKGAFKAIQYMALGIPAVVSAVGANAVAVADNKTGFTCTTRQEWYERLELLLQDAELRKRLGLEGKRWVEQQYSVQAHEATFLKLFT